MCRCRLGGFGFGVGLSQVVLSTVLELAFCYCWKKNYVIQWAGFRPVDRGCRCVFWVAAWGLIWVESNDGLGTVTAVMTVEKKEKKKKTKQQ